MGGLKGLLLCYIDLVAAIETKSAQLKRKPRLIAEEATNLGFIHCLG